MNERDVITDLSDLLDQLESNNGSLAFELAESLREPLRVALIAGMKMSLHHPKCSATPLAHVQLEQLTAVPNDGTAYQKRLRLFEYTDHQSVSLSRELMVQACGWLEYASYHSESRMQVLSSRIEALAAEQAEGESVALPLSLVHETADWVQNIQRNDTYSLAREIRASVKKSLGIIISQPGLASQFEESDDAI